MRGERGDFVRVEVWSFGDGCEGEGVSLCVYY